MKKTLIKKDMQIYLQPTPFIDSDSVAVKEFARSVVSPGDSAVEGAVKLYYEIRDMIRYSPYGIGFEPLKYKASWVLREGAGFCIQKTILLAAAARAVGIPSRLGFADVRNHLASERLKRLMKTDEFVFHGYNEFYLGDKWVKATPAFNLEMCEKFGVKSLEFNGRDDSLLHPYDEAGDKHMEYIRHHGQFADFPLEKMIGALKKGYPHLFGNGGPGWPSREDLG